MSPTPEGPKGLVCLSTVAAQAYMDGLRAAVRLIHDYDRQWGTTANGYEGHIEHEIEMFRANWERRNNIKLPRQVA